MMTCQVLDYVAQKAEVYELQEALRNWRKKARLTIHVSSPYMYIISLASIASCDPAVARPKPH
jgi:hypothetical protein